MKTWDNRTREVAHLLNPAFCGRILYTTIDTHSKTADKALPLPLIYLILPLILHRATRERISSRTRLLLWVQTNSQFLMDFPKRVRDLVPITNEAMELLLLSGKIELTSNGDLEIVKTAKSLSKTKFTDDEVRACLTKGEHVGKWLAKSGTVETIYIILGVRP